MSHLCCFPGSAQGIFLHSDSRVWPGWSSAAQVTVHTRLVIKQADFIYSSTCFLHLTNIYGVICYRLSTGLSAQGPREHGGLKGQSPAAGGEGQGSRPRPVGLAPAPPLNLSVFLTLIGPSTHSSLICEGNIKSLSGIVNVSTVLTPPGWQASNLYLC